KTTNATRPRDPIWPTILTSSRSISSRGGARRRAVELGGLGLRERHELRLLGRVGELDQERGEDLGVLPPPAAPVLGRLDLADVIQELAGAVDRSLRGEFLLGEPNLESRVL